MTSRLRKLDPYRLTKAIKERLDTQGFAIPKPSQSEPQQPKDGRLIEPLAKYRKTKKAMWERQNRRCADCGKFLPGPAFGHRHHVGGRGLGGSKRDDAKTILLCFSPNGGCHEKYKSKLQWSKGAA